MSVPETSVFRYSEASIPTHNGPLTIVVYRERGRAVAAIEAAGRGVVVYLRQEGRGIGLGNKIAAYALQAEGADTVEANEALGFAADLRCYELAAAILAALGVRWVALMTNSPSKRDGLEAAGVKVSRRVPHWVARHEHN